MKFQNPDRRAKGLHNLLLSERTKRHVTISVGNTDGKLSIVGTSELYLRTEIKAALLDYEISAKGRIGKHAEENVIDEAENRRLKVLEIGASRPICLDCEIIIKSKEIEAKTPFSGKKSKNRKNK